MDYSDTPDKTLADLPSVKEFVEQYRLAYNEVCKTDSPRAKAAYECIFDVANRTDDLVEAQIILERERLLWNIVKDGALDSLVPTLKKMDPLNMATTAKLIGQIHIYNTVTSDEELTYNIDLQEVKDVAFIADYTSKMHLVICIATDLIKYLNAKEEVYAWKTDNLVQGSIKAMVKLKYHLRKILEYMNQYLNMTFDDVLADESLKIWLLKPRNIDEFGTEKQVLNPQYYQIFKDIIDNEILSDVDIAHNLLTGYKVE